MSADSKLTDMSDEEYEYTFDPMDDLVERWGLDLHEAEDFLVNVGYFNTERYHEIADCFNPEEGSL